MYTFLYHVIEKLSSMLSVKKKIDNKVDFFADQQFLSIFHIISTVFTLKKQKVTKYSRI